MLIYVRIKDDAKGVVIKNTADDNNNNDDDNDDRQGKYNFFNVNSYFFFIDYIRQWLNDFYFVQEETVRNDGY